LLSALTRLAAQCLQGLPRTAPSAQHASSQIAPPERRQPSGSQTPLGPGDPRL